MTIQQIFKASQLFKNVFSHSSWTNPPKRHQKLSNKQHSYPNCWQLTDLFGKVILLRESCYLLTTYRHLDEGHFGEKVSVDFSKFSKVIHEILKNKIEHFWVSRAVAKSLLQLKQKATCISRGHNQKWEMGKITTVSCITIVSIPKRHFVKVLAIHIHIHTHTHTHTHIYIINIKSKFTFQGKYRI